MKAILFFLGTSIRWMGTEPTRFLYFHAYLGAVYFLTFTAKSGSSDIYRLIFTAGILAPVLFAISRGLPLNCLDLKTALKKEYIN